MFEFEGDVWLSSRLGARGYGWTGVVCGFCHGGRANEFMGLWEEFLTEK